MNKVLGSEPTNNSLTILWLLIVCIYKNFYSHNILSRTTIDWKKDKMVPIKIQIQSDNFNPFCEGTSIW